jgi:hypothetical protein
VSVFSALKNLVLEIRLRVSDQDMESGIKALSSLFRFMLSYFAFERGTDSRQMFFSNTSELLVRSYAPNGAFLKLGDRFAVRLVEEPTHGVVVRA